MINHVERIKIIVKFKTSMLGQVYKIVVMHMHLWMQLKQPQTHQQQEQQQTIKDIIIKSRTRCTNCISEISNTPIDNAKSIDVVMPMYNLMECSDNYSKISGILYLLQT